MEASLKERGVSQADINRVTPQEAQNFLGKPVDTSAVNAELQRLAPDEERTLTSAGIVPREGALPEEPVAGATPVDKTKNLILGGSTGQFKQMRREMFYG